MKLQIYLGVFLKRLWRNFGSLRFFVRLVQLFRWAPTRKMAGSMNFRDSLDGERSRLWENLDSLLLFFCLMVVGLFRRVALFLHLYIICTDGRALRLPSPPIHVPNSSKFHVLQHPSVKFYRFVNDSSSLSCLKTSLLAIMLKKSHKKVSLMFGQ